MKPTGGAITAGGGYVPYSELTMSRLRDPALRSFLVSIRSTEIPAPRTCDLGEFGWQVDRPRYISVALQLRPLTRTPGSAPLRPPASTRHHTIARSQRAARHRTRHL